MGGLLLRLRRLNEHNVKTLRCAPLAEVSGSLGDLGTLLPLMIALAVQGSIQLDSTLVFSGIFNILTGALFGIPLPVQPMKAIAAAAIAAPKEADMAVVAAAGQWVGLAVGLMSATGLLRLFVRTIPIPVVKGVQLGAGLSLVMGAGASLLKPLHWAHPALDNRIWAIVAFLVLIGTHRLPRFPYALFFFCVALLFAFMLAHSAGQSLPWFHIWRPSFTMPSWLDKHGSPALWMAIGQLPLTTLNSIIAVCQLSADLLPGVSAPSVTSMGLSVALMNLTGTWFGAMPVCHGAGGLAAQHRFGARSGASIMMLGLFKLAIGLAFGETLVEVLRHYPKSLLGVMVLAAGLELAKVGNSLNSGAPDLWMTTSGDRSGVVAESGSRIHRELSSDERTERWNVMLMTTASMIAFRNAAVGFLAGMLCHYALRLSDRWRGSRPGSWRENAPLLS